MNFSKSLITKLLFYITKNCVFILFFRLLDCPEQNTQTKGQ